MMMTAIYSNGHLRLPYELSDAERILMKATQTPKEVTLSMIPIRKTEYLNYGYKTVKTSPRALRSCISFRLALTELGMTIEEAVGEYETTQVGKEFIFSIPRRRNGKGKKARS